MSSFTRLLFPVLLLAILISLPTLCARAQRRHDPQLEALLRKEGSPFLQRILDQPDSFRYQLIYTKISRNRKNEPRLQHQFLNLNPSVYFNPASMAKLPVAVMALEKLQALREKGITKYTTMLTDSACCRQSAVRLDSTAPNYLPSIAHYIRKIFIVSDNDAYNRLYEWVGQATINRRLQEMGYSGSRITRRFVAMNEEENRHTNPIRFLDPEGRLLYQQAAAYNPTPIPYGDSIFVGRAHYNRSDSLVLQPMDFTTHNNLPLRDLQQMVQAIVFPGSVQERQRFRITEEDRRFLLTAMGTLPFESSYPRYDTTEFFSSYTKFFFFRHNKSAVPPHIRSFNKSGWSYGFLTEVAYIADFRHQVEMMLSGTIYVNSDGVLNDNKYEYDSIGYRFFREVGEILYRQERQRQEREQARRGHQRHQLHHRHPFLDSLRELLPLQPKAVALMRGDSSKRQLSLVFTGHEYANGGDTILRVLQEAGIPASFFLTGDFYRNPAHHRLVEAIRSAGHYLGAHSDKHLLYADWKDRDSLLVTEQQFLEDLRNNEAAMAARGIDPYQAGWFLPPYEWYNDSITRWCANVRRQLVNFTPGTLSTADYTIPSDRNYRDNPAILASILDREQASSLNGFILLLHIGAAPQRTRPFHLELEKLVKQLQSRGYAFVTLRRLLQTVKD